MRWLVAVVLAVASTAHAEPTWIDRGIDRFGMFVFDELDNRQDPDAMLELAAKLIQHPAFFAGKPLLAEMVGQIELYAWTQQGRTDPWRPPPGEWYRESASVLMAIGAIDASTSDEALAYALDDFYYLGDFDHAYEAALLAEARYPRSTRTRWTIRRRVELHARHGEFALAARLAKEFIETARQVERRDAFYVASDAMQIWVGLDDTTTALHMLDWMRKEQDRDDISNGAMYMMDAVRLVDDHRLAQLEK